MSRQAGSRGAPPKDSLSAWMTESRPQFKEDKQKLKQRGAGQEECFATLPLGGQDKVRAKLKAEMKKEYNEFLSKQKPGRRVGSEPAAPSAASQQPNADRPPSRLPVPSNSSYRDQSVDRRGPVGKRGEGSDSERDNRDMERREPMGPPPLAPRYDPLEELRLRRYFEEQLHSGVRHGYYGYPPPPLQEDYRYNPYINYYQQMDRVWDPDRDRRNSPPPQREKRVSFPQEWPDESELYGWAGQGRRSEMKMREVERGDREERRESPLNRSRSAPPEKERTPVGFMDGFGGGDRGREEDRRRREEYGRELKEQIRNKQIKHSFVMEGKRVGSNSRPPTPPALSPYQQESPPKQLQQRPLDPLEYYKQAGQPDHFPQTENNTISSVGTDNTPGQKESYRRVLEEQMEESRRRKAQTETEIVRSRDEPVGEWNPWGKGGGGAPLKDSSGRVVADLKVLNKANQAREKTGTSPKLEELADICALKNNISPVQNATDPALSPVAVSPSPSKKSPALTPQQEYREYLRQQVEEKKARRLAEESQQREEDRREAERLENERLKMQEDYQREVAKQREKEEAIRKKNEELKRAAEERKRAPSPPVREQRRERRVSSPEKSPVQALQARSSSPPIPTLRNRQTPDPTPDHLPKYVRERSPPVPSLRRRRTHDLSPSPSPPHVPIRTSETVELVRTESPLSPLLPDSNSLLSPPESHVVRQLTDMKDQLRHENDMIKQQLEISIDACHEADVSRRQGNSLQHPTPKIVRAAKPPFKIKKSSVPPKPAIEQTDSRSSLESAGRRTVGFHLQNTQPKSRAYHREYAPLLKGRGTPPEPNRPDSTESNVSISTLDIEALALKNDNRMKRLESLQRMNQYFEDRKPSPESVINQLLQRAPVRRNKRPSNHTTQEFSL